uniref:VWFA domain-containing protein n=1 Tax=Romanomermis culicivorax TaxID=13658 RepID=A0A915KNL1_ROMCU
MLKATPELDAIGRIYYQGGGSFMGKALVFAQKVFRGLRNPVPFVSKHRHHNFQTKKLDASPIDPDGVTVKAGEDQEIVGDHANRGPNRRLQVLILITDGNSSDPVELAAEKLRRADVQIAAIGVKQHQRESLAVVTRDVDRLFMLDQTYDVVRWLESLKFKKKGDKDDFPAVET